MRCGKWRYLFGVGGVYFISCVFDLRKQYDSNGGESAMKKSITKMYFIVSFLAVLFLCPAVIYGSTLMGELQPRTVVNEKGVIINVTGTQQDDWRFKVLFTVENHTGRDIIVQVRDVSVNGWMIDPTCSCDVAAGKKANDYMSFFISRLNENSISQINSMELYFLVFYEDSWDTYFNSDIVYLSFSKHTHSFDSVEVTKEASCSKTGLKTYTCTADGETKTEIIPATGQHDWSDWRERKSATCVRSGEDERYCYTCYEKETRPIPATGHSPAVKEGRPADCIHSGLTEGEYCKKCYTTLKPQVSIPAKGHKEVALKGKSATCTSEGLTEGKKCSVCGQITRQQLRIPAKGHRIEKLTGKFPTCSSKGLTDGLKCSVCGTIIQKQKVVPKNPHIYGDWKITKKPTISVTGIKQKTCAVCKHTITSKIAKVKPFVKFISKKVKIAKGKSIVLKPVYATGDKIKSWKSSKKSVVTVNKNGKIKAKKAGTAKITVTMKSGKKATCKVKVIKK